TMWHDDEGNYGGTMVDHLSRQVTSELKLFTGGKSVHARQNLFRLTTSVIKWTPHFVPDPNAELQRSEWDYEEWSPPPPVGQPGDDGSWYALLPDGISVGMTPQVGSETAGPFAAAHLKFLVKMWQQLKDDSVIEITDQTRNMMVGDRILLACSA